jgi:SAM-dependent methyltransferase
LVSWRTAPSSEPALGAYELTRCAGCGTAVTLGEAPAALHSSGAYGPRAPRLHRLALPLLRAFDRHRLRLLDAPAEARLLDVGAGRGRFVESARAVGYDARGIEPSVHAGGVVEQVSVQEAALPAGAFDAITAWHVLEHLDDPDAALQRMHSWLRPDGVLLVGVPNLASIQARVGGERWYHLDVPRHRIHFTPAGIEALLRASGFEPLRAHHVLAEHNPFGMWQSLVSRLTKHPSYLYNLLKRNVPVRSPDLAITALAMPLAPVAALAELAAGLAGRGGTIAVVARRLP